LHLNELDPKNAKQSDSAAGDGREGQSMNAVVRTVGAFADRVSRLLEQVDYVRAVSPSDLESIYRLRHDAYLKEGAILPRSEERLADAFDASPNGYNFAIYIDGVLTSALRLHVLSPTHPSSPAQNSFPEHLDPLVAAGATIIDPNRFVADYGRARLFPHLPYATLRLSYMLAFHAGAEFVTCTVRPEHQAFYKREYFAKTVCAPRPYPSLIKPLGLMLVDFGRDREAIIGRHAFYSSTATERRALFGSKAGGRETLASVA
jgi:hypothetical protein